MLCWSYLLYDLIQYKTCAVKCKETLNSKDAKPKTIGHNYILAIYLKLNHKCRDVSSLILYLCETFRKLKVACFLDEKKSATITTDPDPGKTLEQKPHTDDIYINKPNGQQMELEDLTHIPSNQKPLVGCT